MLSLSNRCSVRLVYFDIFDNGYWLEWYLRVKLVVRGYNTLIYSKFIWVDARINP